MRELEGWIRAEIEDARSWVLESLASGAPLVQSFEPLVATFVDARVLIPGSARKSVRTRLDQSFGISPPTTSPGLSLLFGALNSEGLQSLLVEDDLRRKGDGGVSPTALFDGERVFLAGSLKSPAASISMVRSASGYPLNAFVSRTVLIVGHDNEIGDVSTFRANVGAVLVSAFDAESYLVLLRDA